MRQGDKGDSQCGRGQQASRVAGATGYAGPLHDYFSKAAEASAGDAGATAMAPTGYIISAIGAVSTFVSSIQRGEPVDVAYMRATSPLVSGALGGVGGALAGAAAGGAAGSVVPILGNGAGAVGGGIAGGVAGAVVGEKLGEMSAEEYARARGYGGC